MFLNNGFRALIFSQQTGDDRESSEVQSENCFNGRERPGRKELKRV
jgi:hypothetical protein